MRQGLSRLQLALVLVAFCFPLFIGLGTSDLANDEAIYSFAVESILRTGDWLSPRSSPNLGIVFLEKPPLKFWIVAAPIRLGVLPLDEFGLRFVDAVFGSLAFVYVFLIGRRLAGPICGLTALVVLFAHHPLLFDHGLRSNNMDAAVVLAYCAGVYHYLRWADSSGRRARVAHAAAVGAAFYLGFMTKFVAALFLPMVLGLSALLIPPHRRRLREDLWSWIAVSAGVVVLIVPWFAYQYAQHGKVLWDVMFGEHVYTRFTAFADPGHLNPWHFYVTAAYKELMAGGSAIWVGWGLAVLIVDAVRARRYDSWTILLWLVVPVTLISLGTSKLYHYFYPYVPPLALAGGYGVAWLARPFASLTEPLTRRWQAQGATRSTLVRNIAVAVAVAGVLLAVITAVNGPVHLQWGNQVIFRNRSLQRPLIAAAIAGIAAGWVRTSLAAGVVLLAWLLLPTPLSAYVSNLSELQRGTHPFRSMAECIEQVASEGAANGIPVRPVYAPVSHQAYLHPYFYYLSGEAWHSDVDDEVMRDALLTPGRERPVITDKTRYAAFLERTGGSSAHVIAVDWPNVALLLPGPYRACRATQPAPVR